VITQLQLINIIIIIKFFAFGDRRLLRKSHLSAGLLEGRVYNCGSMLIGSSWGLAAWKNRTITSMHSPRFEPAGVTSTTVSLLPANMY